MKNIVIKEIDQYTSKIHGGKIISEYLIYLYYNDARLECYTEIGLENKNIMVNELILQHQPIEKITDITLNEIILNHE